MLWTALGCAPAAQTSGKSTSEVADFELPRLDGGSARLSRELRRGLILLDFWDSRCEPCLDALPELQRLFLKYREQGFTVLAITVDGPDQISNVRAQVSRYQLTFPVLLDTDAQVFSGFSSELAIPLSVLIDARRHVLFKRRGYSRGDEAELEQRILEALAEQPARHLGAALN